MRRETQLTSEDVVVCNVNEWQLTSSSESDEKNDKGILWQPPRSASTLKSKPDQCRLRLPTVALCADRYCVSDRHTAALFSATLRDVGHDDQDTFDRSKVRRESKSLRGDKMAEISEQLQRKSLRGLFFDGRKDRSLSVVEAGGTSKKNVTVDEHITLLEEPGSQYLGHFTPACGTAVEIKSGIFDFLVHDNNVSFNHLMAVGCDATNVNTGQNGGVIRLIESDLQCPYNGLYVCSISTSFL